MYIFKLALKELKNGPKFVISFTFNLLLGISGLCFVLSAGESIEKFFMSRSRDMMASDLRVSKRTPFSKQEKEILEQMINKYKIKGQEKITTFTMINLKTKTGGKVARLANLMAIGKDFPYYGNVKIKTNDSNLSSLKGYNLYNSPGIWIANDLFEQYDIKIGDYLKIGEGSFLVSGIIIEDSTLDAGSGQFTPKIYLSHDLLNQSSLLHKGSTAFYYFEYSFDQNNKLNTNDIKKELLEKLTNNTIRVSTSKESKGRVNRVLSRLKDYLSLIAIAALFLSMIGLGHSISIYLLKKRKEIGILKSLGLSDINLMVLFFCQISILVILACVLSTIPISLFLFYLQKFFTENLDINMNFFISINVLLKVIIVTSILLFLLSIPIIKLFSSVNTLDLLSGEQKSILTGKSVLYLVPFIFSFHPLCVWQSKSWTTGSIFYISLLLCFILGSGIVFLILKKGKNLLANQILGEKKKSLSFSLAYRYLIRDPLSSNLAITSITLGICLSVIVFQIEKSFVNELMQGQGEHPSLFLFDIQEGQVESLIEYTKKMNIKIIEMAPMIKSRIAKINDENFIRDDDTRILTREDERSFRMKNRGVNLTYKKALNKSEEIVDGKIWDNLEIKPNNSFPEISIEKRYAKTIGVKLGDKIEFDIMGIPIIGKITSIRRVRWTSFLPNFFIAFSPGVLEDAPKTYVAAIEKLDLELKNQVATDLAEMFPNISQVNVYQVIDKIFQLFLGLSKSVKYMALFCLIVGLVVLSSIFKLKINERRWDMGMLKVLGMKASDLGKVLWWELMLITLYSLIFGTLLGILIGAPLTKEFLGITWFFVGKEVIQGSILLLIITNLLWWYLTRNVIKTPARRIITN